jgi:hypothetical protein
LAHLQLTLLLFTFIPSIIIYLKTLVVSSKSILLDGLVGFIIGFISIVCFIWSWSFSHFSPNGNTRESRIHTGSILKFEILIESELDEFP